MYGLMVRNVHVKCKHSTSSSKTSSKAMANLSFSLVRFPDHKSRYDIRKTHAYMKSITSPG